MLRVDCNGFLIMRNRLVPPAQRLARQAEPDMEIRVRDSVVAGGYGSLVSGNGLGVAAKA
jgi:hypothetical protein